MSQPDRRNVLFLLLLSLGHLVTDIYQGSLPGLLPFVKDQFGLSYTAVGSLLMVSNITSSVIQPLFGYFSDVSGQLWLLPLGIFLASLGLALVGFSQSLPLLYAFVVISGLGIASYHPEGARIAHHLAGDRRATGMSLFSVGGNLGFALGPVLAIPLVSRLGLQGTGFMLIPGLLTSALFLLLLPQIGHMERTAAPKSTRKDITSLPPNNWSAQFMLLGMVAIRSLIQLGLVTYIPFYYLKYLNGNPTHSSYLLAVFLGSGAIGTLIGGCLADHFGRKPVIVASMAAMIPLQALLLYARGWSMFVLLSLAGIAIVSTFTVTLVMSQEFMPRYVGVASGLTIGFAIGMGGVGVTALGAVADTWGVPQTLSIMIALPVAGLILATMLPAKRHGAPASAAALVR